MPAYTVNEPHPTMATGSWAHPGRGGAGNAVTAVPKPVLSFDEELERAQQRESAAVGHVGRGGAGNVFASSSGSEPRTSGEVAPRRDSSNADAHSIRSGFWARISGSSLHH